MAWTNLVVSFCTGVSAATWMRTNPIRTLLSACSSTPVALTFELAPERKAGAGPSPVYVRTGGTQCEAPFVSNNIDEITFNWPLRSSRFDSLN